MILYFDTSALIKLVVAETGSDIASALWDAPAPVASSILSYPEGCAALAAARRAGRLTAGAHARARTEFESLQRELLAVGVDGELARRAGSLAEQLGLRGYDAVHLAAATALAADATLVTWDEDLRRAAVASGCGVAPGG